MNRKPWSLFITFNLLAALLMAAAPAPQSIDTNPPEQPVKLIFIHHSTGENWLTDGYGDLGRLLGENNYFVSDTNYGWGPDAIGDRTDIPNWIEWFASENTPTYLNALFQENGQNSDYTRSLADPGGENTIIMFKSCFPNSDLSGSPNDPPGTYEELSVAGAKHVYNTILPTFAAHPDKLFIVITSPPLSDPTHAANARAFTQWLLNDWLLENKYPYKNVAVFDFYNILTYSSAHHRIDKDQVEYIQGTGNTLAYPSGDDHPSIEGSLKASADFVPLLNYFYHQWIASGPPQIVNESAAPTAAGDNPVNPSPSGILYGSLIDNFEGQAPAGTSGWEAYFEDAAQSNIACTPDTQFAQSGSISLRFDFKVQADSWATCGIYFDTIQSWASGNGITFQLHADQVNLPYHIDVYSGSPEARTTYVYHAATPAGSDSSWVQVDIPWSSILRVEWEENAGTPLDPTFVTGFSIGIATAPEVPESGTIWLDELSLTGDAAPAEQPHATSLPSVPEEEPATWLPNLPCVGSIFFMVFVVGMIWIFQRR